MSWNDIKDFFKELLQIFAALNAGILLILATVWLWSTLLSCKVVEADPENKSVCGGHP